MIVIFVHDVEKPQISMELIRGMGIYVVFNMFFDFSRMSHFA